MKFITSSSILLSHIQPMSRVISSSNILPILDGFLFVVKGNDLKITASDLETTLVTTITLDNVEGDGAIVIPAKLLIDGIKGFSDQPLSFDINTDTRSVVISSENGECNLVGQDGMDFPSLPEIKKETMSAFNIHAGVLLSGITKTIFATADDELRPVMGGIFVEASTDKITFVASDAHKLVRYQRTDAHADDNASFILPKKPASLLKNILPKEEGTVAVEFDDKNAFFSLSDYKVVCRLVEGNYPNYNSVIPKDNHNKVIIDRVNLANTLKRVSVFANQSSNLVKLDITTDKVVLSAQDLDFSISAYERIACKYEGDEMVFGFKSSFLLELLSHISSENVVIELSDPLHAGLFLPDTMENESESLLILLMPMMVE